MVCPFFPLLSFLYYFQQKEIKWIQKNFCGTHVVPDGRYWFFVSHAMEISSIMEMIWKIVKWNIQWSKPKYWTSSNRYTLLIHRREGNLTTTTGNLVPFPWGNFPKSFFVRRFFSKSFLVTELLPVQLQLTSANNILNFLYSNPFLG